MQILKIIPYWLAGIALGAFFKTLQGDNIKRLLLTVSSWENIVIPIIIAAILGAVSPITLFGIIPVLYIFDNENNKKLEAVLTAFITTSILISPNIFIFTISLGLKVAIIRLLSSISAGVILGLIISLFSKSKEPFLELNMRTQGEKAILDMPGKNKSKIYQFKTNFIGAFKKTGINLIIGIFISFIIYILIPDSLWELTFTNNNLAVPISAFLSVGLYQCGGGSIPILQALMREGLGLGAAITFMMVGPLTKMTNLAALKSILSLRKLIIYCIMLILYMLIIGWSLGS